MSGGVKEKKKRWTTDDDYNVPGEQQIRNNNRKRVDFEI